MIISHKYKYIFVKTEKTAGTSIEIALSEFCGPDDVVTPISSEDERKRNELGFVGPQNYYIPFSRYSKRDILDSIIQRERLKFFNHASASFIKKYVDPEVWNHYYKFCFERNPFDKVVSWYYWLNRSEPRPSIQQFIESGRAHNIRGFDLYALSSRILVDRVYKFEEIDDALLDLTNRVTLPNVPKLPHAKGGYRKDKRSYRDILNGREKDLISKAFAREIAYFDYSW